MTRMITKMPAQKVAASALGSAVSVVAIWALNEFANVEMPTVVQPAFVLCITFLVGYFVPPAPRDQVTTVDPNSEVTS
ncbi:MAG: hypothetical protein ACPG6L_08540 [Nereida ignava]